MGKARLRDNGSAALDRSLGESQSLSPHTETSMETAVGEGSQGLGISILLLFSGLISFNDETNGDWISCEIA
jgi:hypothetical protein